VVSVLDNQPFYQAMTQFPRHIEERLLRYNVLQLCALVSEKPGPRWSGASDRYGPIKEIERRWKLDDLAKRIEDIVPEEPLMTYARMIAGLGGDPNKEYKKIVANARSSKDIEQGIKVKERIDRITKPIEPDTVRDGLANCENLDDLKRVAAEQGLADLDWAKIDGLANFGLKRMYVGNKWRTKLRRESKGGT